MTVTAPPALPVRLANRFAADPMLRNSVAIMATSVATSLLGYVFWLIVARTSPPEVSGAGAAATSALQAAALFACVGAAAAMIEWLPRSASAVEWRRRLTAGVGVAAAGGTVGGLLSVGCSATCWARYRPCERRPARCCSAWARCSSPSARSTTTPPSRPAAAS